MKNKIKSFTLAELLVVMIITAIVIGMAFSVLRLVQKQIFMIKKNALKSETILLLEQRLWQDFNTSETISYNATSKTLLLKSPTDTARYYFNEKFILRNIDTIPLKVFVQKAFFNGNLVGDGDIDAMSISIEQEIPDYHIFVSRKNDVTFFMNQDGF